MYTGQIVMFGLALLLTTVIVIKADHHEKPGVCPPERHFTPYSDIPHDKCKSDTECEGDKKCCPDNDYKFCKPPAKERSGECPPAPKPEIKNREDFCSSDSECAAGSKCCFGSNGKTCLPCDKVKAGNCKQTEVIQCVLPERSLCNTDCSCPNDEKCCPKDCHFECQKPV
ncbi:WAP four-disulfide core domain protein 5-like isoform X2 [Pelobates fuscus]|uniref:WAP four-disulfide core domain protein 5-like isoform X2 n=1 Tax=Pelobates fuscus TaxID=191477 RepID=UPI002FE43612